MRNAWFGIAALASLAGAFQESDAGIRHNPSLTPESDTVSDTVIDVQDYAPKDAILYTLSMSVGQGQEGPGASFNLGFHTGHLVIGALAAGAGEIIPLAQYPLESHAEGALLVGYSHIDRMLFLEMSTGISRSYYVRRSHPILPDSLGCTSEYFEKCGGLFDRLVDTPWGIPLEFTFGLHSGGIGLGFTLGANINDFAPDNYALVRLWSGFDARFSVFDDGPNHRRRMDLRADVHPPQQAFRKPFLSGAVITAQGLGPWAEKRWEFSHGYLSAGGGSTFRPGEAGQPEPDWAIFPALQIGNTWGLARRSISLSTGVGVFAGRDGGEKPDMFAINVPVQATYLFRFRAIAPGLIGGLLFNEPRAGYFLGLVAGF